MFEPSPWSTSQIKNTQIFWQPSQNLDPYSGALFVDTPPASCIPSRVTAMPWQARPPTRCDTNAGGRLGRQRCHSRRRGWRSCLASDSTAYLAVSAVPTSERRLSDRRPRDLIFSQFSIDCCQNAFASRALPPPSRWGLTAYPPPPHPQLEKVGSHTDPPLASTYICL